MPNNSHFQDASDMWQYWISCTWRSQYWYTSIVDNTGIKNYSSIVIFFTKKKYNTGIKSYSSIVNNTVRKYKYAIPGYIIIDKTTCHNLHFIYFIDDHTFL